MVTSILKSIINIQKYANNDLNKITVITKSGQPRINKQGDPLDAYIKDSFCDSFFITDPNKKYNEYKKYLSHLGNQNKPPDIMIFNEEAIEVKKVEGITKSSLALNSSYPKQILLCDDPMITEECKTCEQWKKKDMIYCIGNVEKNHIKVITFVYGDCYAAKKETYEAVKKSMVDGIKSLKITLSKTNELARLNKIDPLEITDLRIRGMFQIAPPLSVFSEIIKPNYKSKLNVFLIVKKEKFESFDKKEKEAVKNNMSLEDIKIKDPDDPQKLLDAKLISFSF